MHGAAKVSSSFAYSSLLPFSSVDIGKLVLPEGMQNLNMQECYRITGKTVKLVKHFSWECGSSRTRLFLPRFRFFLLTSFPVFAGDVAQLQLPASMQYLDLGATQVKGMFARASRNVSRSVARPVRQNKV